MGQGGSTCFFRCIWGISGGVDGAGREYLLFVFIFDTCYDGGNIFVFVRIVFQPKTKTVGKFVPFSFYRYGFSFSPRPWFLSIVLTFRAPQARNLRQSKVSLPRLYRLLGEALSSSSEKPQTK